jgi:hypothetical protein
MLEPTYNDISGLLTYFNANAYSPELLPNDLAQTPQATVAGMRASMELLLEKNVLGVTEFKKATACEPRDHNAARSFFEQVYRFAFEDGDEPDLAEYWNR